MLAMQWQSLSLSPEPTRDGSEQRQRRIYYLTGILDMNAAFFQEARHWKAYPPNSNACRPQRARGAQVSRSMSNPQSSTGTEIPGGKIAILSWIRLISRR